MKKGEERRKKKSIRNAETNDLLSAADGPANVAKDPFFARIN